MEKGKWLQLIKNGFNYISCNIVKFAVILLLLSLIGILFYYKFQTRKFQEISQVQAVKLSTLQDSVKVIKQKNGELSYKIEAVEVDKRNLRQALEIAGFEIKDLKEKEIKYKNLIAVLELTIQGFGKGQSEVRDTIYITEKDTVYVQLIRDWSDSRLNLFDMRIIDNQFTFGYTYTIHDLGMFVEEKKDSWIVTAAPKQPGVKIVSGNSIVIVDKKGFFERPIVWAIAGFTGGILITR
jgi:hypothetical protein